MQQLLKLCIATYLITAVATMNMKLASWSWRTFSSTGTQRTQSLFDHRCIY